MLKAVLFKSKKRFSEFEKKLSEYGVEYSVLDFYKNKWLDFDFSDIDFVIYYPSYKYDSNYPLTLYEAHDNLIHIKARFPSIKMFPDPNIICYYNDKYKQHMLLKSYNYPIPLTFPLFSKRSVDLADEVLGYPMVLKNRYGAGGGNVYKVNSKKELMKYYNISTFNFWNIYSMPFLLGIPFKRIFYYNLIRAKQMSYPFLSPPLLAQEFIEHDRDLKTVVGNYKVVEAHWRIKAHEEMWKVNIDGGGIGEWSKVPQEVIDLSERLARQLQTSWINLDLISKNGEYLISEFSPVWHHYAYKEKPSFVYKDDYNIDMPLEISLDLERIIVESLITAVGAERNN